MRDHLIFAALVIIGLVLISLTSSALMKRMFGGGLPQSVEEEPLMIKILIEDRESVQKMIEDGNHKEITMQIQHLNLQCWERRRYNVILVNALKDIEGGAANAYIWMKQNLDQEVNEQILKDIDYASSCKDRFIEFLTDTRNQATEYFNRKNKDGTWCSSKTFFKRNLCRRMRLAVAINLDLLKDLIIVAQLAYIQGERLFVEFATFPSVLTWILAASIFLSLLVSAIETVHRYPLAVVGNRTWTQFSQEPPGLCKTIAIRMFVVCFYFTIPAVLINMREEAEAVKDDLLNEGRIQFHKSNNHDSVDDSILKRLKLTNEYLTMNRKAVLTYKRNELSMEIVPQIIIQLTMLLLNPSATSSATHSGLQAIFYDDKSTTNMRLANLFEAYIDKGSLRKMLLILSITWSLRSLLATTLKIEIDKKGKFLPLTCKAVFWLRSLISFTTRIVCILTFFGPFLGLLGSLSHWKNEQKPLSREVFNRYPNWTYQDPRSGEINTVPLTTFHRADYGDPDKVVPPAYTEYTLVPLQTAFVGFSVLLLLQAVVSTSIKSQFSSPFQSATWTSKLQHLVETLHMPKWYADWEQGEGGPEEHRLRCWMVYVEIIALIGVQLVSNLMLLVPIWITGEVTLYCEYVHFQV